LIREVSAELAAPGARSSDGAVSVDEVFCLGNCALGPAALVNERLVGRVDLDRLRAVVLDARQEAGA
jgi:formate dehydrogenase subunit gamma